MKSVVISFGLVMILCVGALAQTNETSPCPTIEVIGPAGITTSGETMTFTASVSGNNNSSVVYNWTISDGTIIEGLGTSIIKVATNADIAGKFISATVSLNGLPVNCKNTASQKAEIAYVGLDPVMTDEYGRLSFKEERARLDNIAFQLKDNKDYKAYFIIYVTEEDKSKAVKSRISKIQNYFAENHKISKERIVILTSKAASKRTQIYLVPSNASFPYFETK